MRKKRDNCEQEIRELHVQLEEAQEALRAIRSGEVDAIVAASPQGEKIFSLKNAEHPYRLMVEAMNEGAATLNAEGDIIYCNFQLARILDVPLEKIFGTTFITYVKSDQQGTYRSIIDAALKGGGGAGQTRLITPGNGVRYVYLSARSLELESKQAICLVVTDLTVERQNRERLESTEKELNEARRLSDIGTLASTVAHELRNPLAAIKLAAANIKRKARDYPPYSLASIEKKVNESDQIINNLLFYTRLKVPHFEKVNISAILKDCIQFLKETYAQKPVGIFFDDSALTARMMEVDPLEMRELFINLINNSWDAVAPVTGKIELFAKTTGNYNQFIVRDNGRGIYKEHLPNLFKPFFSTKTKGTGLGLYVSKQIVQFHKGTIDIESEPGEGTTITIRLPTA